MSSEQKPTAKDTDEPKPQYFAALTYFFEHPEWANSLLMGSLLMFIPVLNAIVIAGYRYEIVEAKLRNPHELFPKFDFNRLSQYLTRGIWPFLVDIILQMVLVVPILVIFYGSLAVVGIVAANDSRMGIIVGVIVIPLVMLGLMAISLLVSAAVVPLHLRAGLSQDLGQTLNWPWIKDFLRKVGLQTLLFTLFIMAAGMVLGIAGYLACLIGMVPVIFVLAGPVLAHIHYQLYTLYLARGGEPIPLKNVGQASSLPDKTA